MLHRPVDILCLTKNMSAAVKARVRLIGDNAVELYQTYSAKHTHFGVQSSEGHSNMESDI